LRLADLASEHLWRRDRALRTTTANEGDRPVESTAMRFLKPVSATRWTASQSSQATKPDMRTRPTLAIA
jgi:hypothetical protein